MLNRWILGILVGLMTGGAWAAECQKLVYAANPSYPPYHWSPDSKRYEGASIALLKLVAPADLQLEPEVYPWKRALLLAEQGKIDLVLSLRITPERERFLSYTKAPAFPNNIVLFTRRGSTLRYSNWSDLKPYTGGIALGDTFGGGFDDYWRQTLHVEETGTMVENFKKLAVSRIDYYITSLYLGRAYLARNGLENQLSFMLPPVTQGDIHFGFSRASPCAALVDQFNERLAELNRKGVPQRLLDEALENYRRAAP